MTATNHVVTGALIGSLLANPVLAWPLAFVSHFALDALPHYDTPESEHTSKRFLYTLLSDMALAGSVLLALLVLRPESWLVIIGAGIFAASPDLMWFPRWLNELRGRKNPPLSSIAHLHSRIQKYAKSSNWYVELIWLGSMIFLITSFAF